VTWGGIVVLLWLIPDAARAFVSLESAQLVNERLSLVVPALLVPVAMCLFPVGPERQSVLTWDTWARGVDWGMILFIGGVLVLGSAVAAPETGIPDALRLALEPRLGSLPEYAIVFVLTLGVLLVTGGVSNLVTMSIFLPFGLALFSGLHIGHPAALGLVLGMGASMDYLLPSGTTTNAIVAASGWMRISAMLRYGLVIAFGTAIVLTCLSYPLAKWLLASP
jgi:sodium-dependent dicarboxylate transporter 2/3/5